jgi:Rap1a immunity proteins
MRSILACALLCAATMQASAQYPNGYFVDGNELMTWCEPRNVAGPSDPLCLGYVAGISDALNFSRQLPAQRPNTNCTPPGVTIARVAHAVVNYINRNPDKRDLSAAHLVVAAIDEAWCSQASAVPSVHYQPR